MILNNIERDIALKILRDGRSQLEICNAAGITPSYFTHAKKRSNSMHVSMGTVKILESMGYDIKLQYVKRKETGNDNCN